MSLPASTDFTGAAITEAQFKTAISDMRTFLADLLGTDGLSATALTTMGAILNATLSKSAAYTVVAGDKGKLIDYTSGTYTLTLTAAATLGAGFSFAVRNSGAGVITIDPNSTELIDGAATLTLAAGESCFVLCSGTAFKTVSKAAALTSSAINTALGYTAANAADVTAKVAVDHGVHGIGMEFLTRPTISSCASGATIAGTGLQNLSGAAIGVGTWRNTGSVTSVWDGAVSTFQRIS